MTASSQWTSSMPPASPSRGECPQQRPIVDPEVVDHEGLERRHAGLDRGRQLGDGVVLGGVTTRLTA